MKLKLLKLPKLPKRSKFFKFLKTSKLPGFSKLSKLPVLPSLPEINLEPVKKTLPFINKYKLFIFVLVLVIVFITVALVSRGYVLSKLEATPQISGGDYYATSSNSSLPAVSFPSPSDANIGVQGASTYSPPVNTTYITAPTPFPTFAPLPAITPFPTPNPNITTTITTNSSSSTNPINPNCTTGSGVPNSWYSDVYPNPPVTTNTGSVTLIVDIRDCNVNLAPVSDSIKISLISGDPNTEANGNKLPYTVTTQNGEAKFSLSSQLTGSVTIEVQDTTKNFTVTDINNNNPVISFTNNTSGNSNCTTGTGVPNFWYSDVSPVSPVSAAAGSTVTFTVDIRDCSQNDVSSDSLTISQTSNDSSLTVNGKAPPVNIQAQNGQATFTVSSQNAGTDTLSVQDTTSNFTVTDANNHNPSITFSSSSASSPTPAPSATPTPSPSVTPTPTPTSTSSASATSSSTSTSSP